MFVPRINQFVKEVLFELKGVVPKGEPVEFNFTVYDNGDPTIHFTAIQIFGEEDQLPPQTEPEKR